MLLTDLLIGKKGIIQYIDDSCKNKKRLKELGFTQNTEIAPLHKNNSLTAYWVKGTVIALRRADSDKIEVSEVL